LLSWIGPGSGVRLDAGRSSYNPSPVWRSASENETVVRFGGVNGAFRERDTGVDALELNKLWAAERGRK
jgi:hypothetical protein